jgi:hypothetical protein
MANTFQDYTATADQTDFAFTFDYLEDEHVTVEINGVVKTLGPTADYTIETSPTKKIVLTTGATAGQIVRVRRKSQPGDNLVDFVNGSVLTESELDRAYLHNRYLAEEISELNDASLQLEQGGTQWDAKNKRITNVGTPTALADATTKAYVDGIASAIATGVGITPDFNKFTGDGTTDTFSLSFTTNGVASSAVLVSINGAVQDPDDYTIAGGADEIQFDTPPANLSEILVIERGYKVATDIPTEYDWGSVATDPVSASYSYGQIV